MHVYKIIREEKELDQLIKYCKQTRYCSSDFETNGGNANELWAFPTILGVSFQPGSSWIIPLGHKESPFTNWVSLLKKFGREVIENPDIVKIGQNIKYEYQWWLRYGITMQGRVFDTMLAKYLLDEERPHGLKEMVARFIPEYAGYGLKRSPSDKATDEQKMEFWGNVPLEELSEYCSLDSDLTFRLMIYFEPRLIKGNFYFLFRNMLMMATRVLAETERTGMVIDKNFLYTLVDTYAEKIKNVEEALYKLPCIVDYEERKKKSVKKALIKKVEEEIEELKANGESERIISNREKKLSGYLINQFTNNKEKKLFEKVNFNSPAQMIDLLFESKHGFGFDPFKKTDSGSWSTDEETLLILKPQDKSGFIDHLLEYRELTKLYSTYILGMKERLLPDNTVHGSFLLHGTVTGRLSSRNPNLQNIPRNTTSGDIKKMFIAPKGMLLLQMDYSQAELRVLAAMAKEKTMLEWFRLGHDIHLATACKKYGVAYDEIAKIIDDENHKDYNLWKIRRKQAKTTNFGIAYEQGAKKLADKMREQGVEVTDEEAEDFLKDWFKDFPSVKKHIHRQHRMAEEYGYVYSLFGRKRRLPNVDSDNKWKRLEALRQSMNTPIQSAASDYALFSSILIRDRKLRGLLPAEFPQIGTVHDSIMFYVYPEDIHTIVPILKDIAKNPETKTWFNFEVTSVDMEVDFEVGTNWLQLHKYNPKEDYSKWVA